ADRHDVLAREVLAQLVQGLGQRGDVRVLVELRLGDERRPAQGQELTGLGVVDEAGRDLRVAHEEIVADIPGAGRARPGSGRTGDARVVAARTRLPSEGCPRQIPVAPTSPTPRRSVPRSPRPATPRTGSSRSRARTGRGSCTPSPARSPAS